MTERTLFSDPTAVFAFLAGTVAFIYWVAGLPRFRKFFEYTPQIIYVYFLPMVATTLGLTPSASPAYDWLTRNLLPFALLLLMISVDLKGILRLGPMALFMVVAGTVGIIAGGPISYLLFRGFLPADAWTGFAALSGSWIGGTANMLAIAESVGTPNSAMGPIIVVDTVVGYGWMGILLFFSGYQTLFDRRTNARTAAIEETNLRMAEIEAQRLPLTLRDTTIMIGLGMAGSVLSLHLGGLLPRIGEPTIISSTTWAVLIVVTGGLLLSLTRLREFEKVGASHFGYAALYLLVAAIGAQADLRAVLQAPVYLLAGAVWIAIHAGILLGAARIVKAPLFFVATGSMANVGGAASAPVVAGIYHPAMAPVGLLMAVLGYILGIYGAVVCAWLLGLLAV